MQKNIKGRFITFEGLDGSGKSTQLSLLSQRLSKKGVICECQCEPTNWFVGRQIREILHGNQKADSRTMALLFAADRIEHVTADGGILSSIIRGTTVLSDRYYLSSFAYQMVDMPLDWVVEINRMAMKHAKPDCHIFIDVSPKTCLDRIAGNRTSTDIFENSEVLTRARKNFFEVFEKLKNQEKIIIVDGNADEKTVSEAVWKNISNLFE